MPQHNARDQLGSVGETPSFCPGDGKVFGYKVQAGERRRFRLGPVEAVLTRDSG